MIQFNPNNDDEAIIKKTVIEIVEMTLPPLVEDGYESRHEIEIDGGFFCYGYKMVPTPAYYFEFMNDKREVTVGSYKCGSKMVLLDVIHERNFDIPKEHMNALFMDLPI